MKLTNHLTRSNRKGQHNWKEAIKGKRKTEKLTTSTTFPPLLPSVATVLVPSNTNPPPDAAVVVVVELADTNPAFSLVVVEPTPPPPTTTEPSPFTVPAVMIPPIVPLQAAPVGQHATFPA